MSIPKKVREALRERSSGDSDVGLCEICGTRGNNAHHRMNKSQGGQDVLSNLMLLCGSGSTGCHGKVTENPDWADRYGYTVYSYENPAEKLVWRICLFENRLERVYLDDDGGVRRAIAA